MGTTQLSSTRLRNQKRRQSRKGRTIFGNYYELGGTLVNAEDMTLEDYWRNAQNKKITNELRKANDKQVAGNHYKSMGVQVWDVVDTWPLDQRIGYYRGNALKYTMRMGSKDASAQEIEKGIHYLEKLLEVLKEKRNG